MIEFGTHKQLTIGMGNHLIRSSKVNERIFISLVSLIFVNYFVYWFINQESYIYFWDYYLYWDKYQNFSDLFIHNPMHAIKELYRTIQHDDYNLLPVAFLTPYYALFGPDRITYILAIAGVYAFPASILSAIFIEKYFSDTDGGNSSAVLFLSLSTFLFLPQYWIPILFGFPDAVGIVFIYLIFFLLVRKPFEEQKFRDLIWLGILLTLLIMLRRWYAYWVVSFFIAIAIERFFALSTKYSFQVKSYMPMVRNIFIVGAISLTLFFILARPIAERMLSTDYADIYSAFKRTGSIVQFFHNLYNYFGLFTSALFLISLANGLFSSKTRNFFILLVSQFLCSILIFSRVQDFSIQHHYLVIPTIIMSISIFVVSVFNRMKNITTKSILLLCYISILMIQFSVMFNHKASDYFFRLTPLFSWDRHYPLVRNDLSEIHKLLERLADLTSGGGQKVYVIGSSIIFNDDILRNACLSFSYSKSFCDRILHASHIDKRDGFPVTFLSASYVAIAAPTQYHERPEDQMVVGILADEIRNSKGIGYSFEKLSYEFALDNDVRISIYKKIKPFNESDLTKLEGIFLNVYPQKKDIFSFSRIQLSDNITCDLFDKLPGDVAKTKEINYSNRIKLLSVTTDKLSKDQIKMTYYWQLVGDLGKYDQVFVHFMGADFQGDHALCQKWLFTELKGKVIKETQLINVPPSALGREVMVKIGMFDPTTPKYDRLKIESAATGITDENDTCAIVEKLPF